VEQFRKQLRNSAPQSRLQFPCFPHIAIAPLQNCIRFTNHEQAFKIYDVLSWLQIFKARISSDERLTLNVINMRILDGVKLHVLAEGLLCYARCTGRVEPQSLLIMEKLNRLGFNQAEDPQLFQSAGFSVLPL
jgi:hypothetical protein